MRTGLLDPGVVVGGWRLGARLGLGGEAEIWRAEADGVVVALKLLRDPADAFARARFAREVACLRRIEHPNVVHLFDAGDEGDECWAALELLDHGTLATALDDGRLPLTVAAAALAPIADALAAAHAAGVVHRDVKPGNIVLAGDGPRLIDFGAAALDGTTLDGFVDGAAGVVLTEAYAAPETLMATAVLPTSDVWSLAISFVECVTGVPDPSAGDARFGPAEDLLRAALSLDPGARPSMDRFAEALHEIALGADAPVVLRATAQALVQAPAQAPVPRETGREIELGRIADIHDAAVAAVETRALLLVAAAGAGKSWLLDAAAARAASNDVPVLRAACREDVGDLRALAPWVRHAGSYEQLVARVGPDAANVLARRTGAHGAPGSTSSMSIVDALVSLLASHSAPLAVLDDAHHADDELLETIGEIAARSGVPSVIVLGARPDLVDADDVNAETMVLGPLPDDVIARVAGADVAAAAGGNPLLALELARAGGGASGSVESLIAARLSSLPGRVASGLARVAACGSVFWPEALGPDVARAMPELCRSGLVRWRASSSVASSTESEWVHPLLREVAYARLGAAEQRLAHHEIAYALDDHAADAESVARHAERALKLGDATITPLAARAGLAAARRALDRWSFDAAHEWTTLVRDADGDTAAADVLDAEAHVHRGSFDEAVDLTRPHVDDDHIGTDARLVLADALVALGRNEEAIEQCDGLLESLHDPDRRTRLVLTIALGLMRTQRADIGLPMVDEQAAALRATGNEAGALQLEGRAIRLLTDVGMLDGSVIQQMSDRVVTFLEHLGATKQLDAVPLEVLSDTALQIAQFHPKEAVKLLDLAISRARQHAADASLARLSYRRSLTAFDLDDVDARRVLDDAETARRDAVTSAQFRMLRYATDVAECGGSMTAPEPIVRDLECVSPVLARAYTVYFAYVDLWRGRLARALATVSAMRAEGGPEVERFALSAAALAGPPFDVPATPSITSMVAHNERALLCYLAGDRRRGDALLLTRNKYLRSLGSLYQSYAIDFPAPIVAALGPAATKPDLDWLRDRIFRSTFPYKWVVHLAIAALLLAERELSDAEVLAHRGLELVALAEPDPAVQQWLLPRLLAARERAAQSRTV